MGSQVNEKKERERKKERKKERRGRKEKEERTKKKKKKRARSLDEWILSKLSRQKTSFLYKVYYAKH